MQNIIPLSMLRPGQSGQVSQVRGDGDSVRRLGELGMRAGTRVEMVQRGNPCIVRLGDKQASGGRLCFRDGDLVEVIVALEKVG